jgi:RNA polymerase sigma-70 factor, ECF subfamily
MSASTGEHRTAVPCLARAAIPRGEADVTDGRYARMGPTGSATAADPDDPDRTLDARFAEGDQTALREAYDRHGGWVLAVARRGLGSPHDAEDVTQQVFAKLMTAIGKYQERDVSFSAWIMRVARNVAVDHLRRRRAIPCEEVRELEPGAEDDASRSRSMMLRDALASLPEEQREVIVLRHLVGLSPGEIAGRLGRTEPSIHGLHHRGRSALRTTLAEMQCGPTVAGRAAA